MKLSPLSRERNTVLVMLVPLQFRHLVAPRSHLVVGSLVALCGQLQAWKLSVHSCLKKVHSGRGHARGLKGVPNSHHQETSQPDTVSQPQTCSQPSTYHPTVTKLTVPAGGRSFLCFTIGIPYQRWPLLLWTPPPKKSFVTSWPSCPKLPGVCNVIGV